jgi:hypothetical protein
MFIAAAWLFCNPPLGETLSRDQIHFSAVGEIKFGRSLIAVVHTGGIT